MILAADKLVFMVVNAVVLVTAQEQAVIPQPAIGVTRGPGEHLPLDDRLQLCSGAVFNHSGEDLAAAFKQADDRSFPGGSTPSFSTHPPRSKIGFVDLDLSGERSGFLQRQLYD